MLSAWVVLKLALIGKDYAVNGIHYP